MSAMGELTFFLGLQVKQNPDGIFISQDKYVQDMLKKFDMENVRPATTPFEASKPKSKDEPDDAVNVHLYRSMIGSLMYLTASRPDIQFAVSACSRHQVIPLTSNLNAVKKIFNDSDYDGSHGDRKSTTGGCQFLGSRLISWQCKKQTIVATSSTEAEYVAAASCCGQVLKIHTDENVADLLTKAFDGPRLSSGEDAPSHPQTVPATITEPDHSHDHVSTPSRPTTTPAGAPVNEQGHSSDPNIASSSRPHKSAPDQFTSTNVEDESMGGSFQTSPPRSTQAPPEGTTSGGAEDLDKLTALSSLVSTLVQKVNTQESDLNAHKLLFKEVVGKLVKKVKLLEDKLKGRKRKFVLTDSDKDEDADQDVDPLIKLAKAAATAAAASAVPTGGSHEAEIPPSSSVPTDEFAGGSDVPAVLLLFILLIVQQRMYEEEKAELEREREEMQRKRKHNVLNSAKYYTDSDWTDIMGQVHAKSKGLTVILGSDVNEDNFAERMVALIAKRRREFAVQRFKDKLNKPMTYAQQNAFLRTFVKNQSFTIYTTGWTMKHVKSFSDDQLKTKFDKIRTVAADFQSQNIKRSLKRPGVYLEQTSTKKSKSTEAPKFDVPADSQQPSVEVPSQKALIADVTKVFIPSSLLPFLLKMGSEAEHKMCLKYASDADSASDDDTPVNLFAVVDKQAEGVGLVLWGDLKVLIDSPETVSGIVLHMFVDKKYPLSVNLIERMLDHQLEICHVTVGNELTTAVQLIAFLKKQISNSRRPKVHDPCFNANFLVADSKYMKVAFGVGFKMLLFNPLVISTKDLSRNLKLTMSNSSLGEDC
ncbi:hypothetical protein Tco_0005613 [Tanacetum coccineum]